MGKVFHEEECDKMTSADVLQWLRWRVAQSLKEMDYDEMRHAIDHVEIINEQLDGFDEIMPDNGGEI